MTEQQKFEAWADAKFGPAPGAIPQHERYASLFEVWQARASQDRSAELLEALEEVVAVFESNPSSISDTVWVTGNRPETLYDHCRAAISKAREVCEKEAEGFGGVAAGPFATDFGKHTHNAMAAGAKNCAAAIKQLEGK